MTIQVKILCICLVLTGCFGYTQNRKYTGYFVKQGETIEMIARQYGVSVSSIKSLNPDVSVESLLTGELLIIPPKTDHYNLTKENDFKDEFIKDDDSQTLQHTIKVGETLFNISKQYNTTPQAIEQLNPKIDIRRLSIGQIILIPNHLPRSSSSNVVKKYITQEDLIKSKINLSNEIKSNIYIAEEGDNSRSVTRLYNISRRQVSRLNSHLGERYHKGDIVFLTKRAKNELREAFVAAKKIDEQENSEKAYILYDVNSKETLYNISKKFNISIIQLYEANPGLEEIGLKSGTVIKVLTPKESTVYKILPETPPKSFLQFDDKINRLDTINIALVLPLKLEEQRRKMKYNSISVEKLFDNKLLNYAINFSMGALAAVDSLKQKGAHIRLKLLDSKIQTYHMFELISQHAFDNIDIVIGPFYPRTFNSLSEYLEKHQIPIVSPVTSKSIVKRSNTILSLPSVDLLRQRIVRYINNERLDARVLLVTEDANREKIRYLQNQFEDVERIPMVSNEVSIAIDSVTSYLSFSRSDSYKHEIDSLRAIFYKNYPIANTTLDSIFMDNVIKKGPKVNFEGKTNLVFVETDNPSTLSGVVSVLNSFVSDTCRVVMVTMDRSKAYDVRSVSNHHLSNLKFHYPSVNSPLLDMSNPYIIKFKKMFGGYPDRYATRGFDLTYDILSRIYREGDLMTQLDQYNTRGVENIFDYQHTEIGGFYNVGTFVMLYEDMYLKEVD